MELVSSNHASNYTTTRGFVILRLLALSYVTERQNVTAEVTEMTFVQLDNYTTEH